MKLRIFAITFLLMFLLSGCYLPVIKKEITIPFIEKSPEVVLQTAIDNMKNINDYEMESTYSIEINFSDDKMSFLNEDVRKKIVKFVNSYSPKVMGIDSETDIEQDVQPVLSGFPEKIVVDYKINAKVQLEEGNTKKAYYNIDLSYALEGMSFNANVDAIYQDEVLYLKFNIIPDMINMFIAQMNIEIKNKWFKIDLNEAKEFQEGNQTPVNINELDEEKMKQINDEVANLYKEYPVLSFEGREKDELIDDQKNYHYLYVIDKSNLEKFIFKALDIYNKELAEAFPLEYEDDKKDAVFDSVIEAIGDNSIDLYIDKKDLVLRLLSFAINIDLSDSAASEMVKKDIGMNISGSFNYKSINEGVVIDIPENAESLFDIVNKQLEGSRMEAKNAKRLSDVKQLATMAELHYANYGAYPLDESELEEFEKFDNPENSENSICPDDFVYSYRSLNEQQDYEITFCLEGEGSRNLPGGIQTIITGGIFAGATNQTDTDGDGLSDIDEVTYGTDIYVKDTDGDGYSDGDEVKNGYNPNGGGKLAE